MGTSRRTAGIVIGIVVGAASIAGGAAAAGERGKADVCHRTGAGEWRRISVSVNAVDAHRGHGDALVGEPVPERSGYTFDDECAPVLSETVLAVAYTDVVDDGRPYDPAVDVLIAKLVDGPDGDGVPGRGDTVVRHRYPTSLTGPFGDDAFEPGTTTEHSVLYVYGRSAINCSVGFRVGDETARARWFSEVLQEGFDDSLGASGPASRVVDRLNWPGRADVIDLDPGSTGRPAGDVLAELARIGDQPFVDVEGDCAASP